MINQIKYRAQNHNGEWIYGIHPWFAPDMRGDILPLFEFFELLKLGKFRKQTLSQYIGKKDINDNDIYSEDIIRIKEVGATPTYYHNDVVEYMEEYAGFAPFCMCNCTSSTDPESYERIGNIHDNPELMKWEDKQ